MSNQDLELFKRGVLGYLRNPKLKCPICKKKRQFKQFDLDCNEGHGYLGGEYARAYVCQNCSVLVVKKEEEIIMEKSK